MAKTFQHRDNSAICFPNDNKKTDKHPDYTGDGVIDGAAKRISIWKKQGARGEYLSFSFTDPKPASEEPAF